ncbi:MAG: glucosyl transferase [Hyphomicrobium sp.]|uniref:glucosyl transferase n=1 Tax=Hyphomicrobium sp. TaxID=82 RepID=UPI0039E4DA16
MAGLDRRHRFRPLQHGRSKQNQTYHFARLASALEWRSQRSFTNSKYMDALAQPYRNPGSSRNSLDARNAQMSVDQAQTTDSSPSDRLEAGGIALQPLQIAFFGHDWTESTIRKRVDAFERRNARVSGFMFSRDHDKAAAAPFWPNIDLGKTRDGNYGRRLIQLLAAFRTIWCNRDRLRAADIIYARNIDMLFIAFVAKHLCWSKAPLVYEALDVHPAFTRPGLFGRMLRFSERRLLSSISLLVVSSPTFMERYFEPVQGYAGSWFLLENKVSSAPEMSASRRRGDGAPWIIGWFGVLRCRRSLRALQELAARPSSNVAVHIRGLPSETDGITKNVLERVAKETPNVHYYGTYQNPKDLVEIYGAVDLTWAVDFSASGANSDWLIPNRLYEGGLHGIPALARMDTATGNIVANDGRGWALAEPFEDSLEAFFATLNLTDYDAMAEQVRSKPRSAFVDTLDTNRLLQKLAQICRRDDARPNCDYGP